MNTITEKLYYVELAKPGSDVWEKVEPASTKDMCDAFCMIAVGSLIEAGYKVRITSADIIDNENFKGIGI